MNVHTVVIADDEPLVRQGVRLVLELDPALEVVAEVADGNQAFDAVRAHRPDVVLLDVRMPRLDGIGAAQRITAEQVSTNTRALMLTTFADEDLLVAAVRAGASGYLLKSMPPPQIRAAVHAALSGETVVAPLLVDRLLHEYTGHKIKRSPILDTLTTRETDVLVEVAAGRSNSEIAARLYIGEGTVKTHVATILRKLAVRDRTQAAVAAYELGLVRPKH